MLFGCVQESGSGVRVGGAWCTVVTGQSNSWCLDVVMGVTAIFGVLRSGVQSS